MSTMPALENLITSLEGELTARHYQTGEGVRIGWKEGHITTVEPAAVEEGAAWVAPALVELQVNGYAGVDFQRDETDEAGLLKAVRALRRDGCARVLLTLITRDWSALLARLREYKALRDANPELREAIFGWHVEGPFISGEPGFIGAHDPAAVCDPSPAAVEALKAVVGEDPTLLTLAAEREGALETIRRARELGIVISLGHSNVPTERLHDAVAAGAAAFTHLGNGIPQALDRHDNILWRVLDNSGLVAGIIPDTHHVKAPLFRLFHRLLKPEQIYWTTDAMCGAGAPCGIYTIGKHTIEVGEDRVAREPGKTNFAGSALEPLRGIELGAQMLGEPWQKVWDYFSVSPARLMGRRWGLTPGAEAAFCLLR